MPLQIAQVNRNARSTRTLLPLTFAIETSGSWNEKAIETIQEIGRRMTKATNDPNETLFLFQRLSVAIQRGNAVVFFNTFPEERETQPRSLT